MKKLLAVLLALLILVGCSGGKSGGGEEEQVIIYQNENVRKAIGYAIDRVAVAKSLNDGSVAAEGIIPFALASNPETGADFRDDQGSVVEYNVDKAKEFYAKACEELGKDELSISLLYGTNEGDSVIKAAEQIAYFLEEVGFKVTLVSKQKKERLQLMTDGDYEVALTRWGPDYADPQTYMDLYLSYNTSNNAGRYNSATYDKQVEDAEATTDMAERWGLFLDAEKTLVQEDFGIIPVFQAGGAMIIRPTISGIQFHSAAVDNYRHIVGKDEVTLVTNTDIIYLDNQYATDGTSFIAETLFTSGLTELDEAGNWVLDLAESYEMSEDGTVYTFKIRDDANWVDVNGNVVRTVTAQDFVDGWNRLISPELASDYSWWISDVLLAKEWEAVDEKTFKVTLEKPNGIFMGCLAFPSAFPINKEFIDAQGDQYATSAETILSCGPYILKSWTPGYSYEYELNEKGYQYDEYVAAGNAKKVVFRVLEDTQTALMEYEAGNIDTVILSGEQVTANKDAEGFVNRLQGYLFYLSININHYE
jgi:ABC-type oligopeptide transport system substrate-binding subunit